MTRVWEQFLTERDRQHLEAIGWRDRAPFGFGSRPAVIVIDDYYSAVGVEREPLLESVKSWPASCGDDGWKAIDKTVELLDAARAASVPIVYHFYKPGYFPSTLGGRTEAPSNLSRLPADVAAKGYDIVDELAPQPGELVIPKYSPSGFHGTALQDHLTYLGVDTIIVVGESTSGCVRATVVDGASRRYRVGVVEECVFDRTQASHAMSLFDMDMKYADVIDLESAKRYFRSVSTAATRETAEAGS